MKNLYLWPWAVLCTLWFIACGTFKAAAWVLAALVLLLWFTIELLLELGRPRRPDERRLRALSAFLQAWR